MSNNVTEFKKIANSRGLLMALGILWVVLFHSRYTGVELPIFVKFPFFTLGHFGVDIFMFLSGFGIFCSLFKSDNLSGFFKRRFLRLFPVFPVMFLYVFANKITSLPEIAGCFSYMNFFVPGFIVKNPDFARFWYISVIFSLYFISPVLAKLINENAKNPRNILLCYAVFLLAAVPFSGTNYFTAVFELSVYFTGMLAGYCLCNGIDFSCGKKLLLYFLSILMFVAEIFIYLKSPASLFATGIYKIPALIFIPGLCFFVANVVDKLKSSKIFAVCRIPFDYLGSVTLEIYLAEAVFLSLFFHSTNSLTTVQRIFAGIFAGILYSLFVKSILKISGFFVAKFFEVVEHKNRVS